MTNVDTNGKLLSQFSNDDKNNFLMSSVQWSIILWISTTGDPPELGNSQSKCLWLQRYPNILKSQINFHRFNFLFFVNSDIFPQVSCYEVTQAINIMGTVCMWPMILDTWVWHKLHKLQLTIDHSHSWDSHKKSTVGASWRELVKKLRRTAKCISFYLQFSR